MRRRFGSGSRGAVASVVVMAAVMLGGAGPATARTEAASSAPALHVSGTHIVDADGNRIQLNGVNRSGTEYACVQNWGIFDGPNDQASITAIATWHVHVVRVPLNEDCWLGINGVDPAYGGSTYRRAIADYFHLLESNGMNVILELHWNAPGTQPAEGQQKMADADHAPAFWRSVTARFGTDLAVVFDLYNEPHDISWACWLHGCTLQPEGWKAAGMQSLVNAVRSAGGGNILMLGGLGWSGDMTRWGAHMPSDPRGQLVASWHLYNFGGCVTKTCWNANVTGVGGLAPILLGEFGETDCKHTFVDPLMAWADGRGIGYAAWTWDDWAGCKGPTVITNYDGTPSAFGQGVHDHYVTRFPALP